MGKNENGPDHHEIQANGARKERVMTKEELKMERDFNN
jgi:hypothetical protein